MGRDSRERLREWRIFEVDLREIEEEVKGIERSRYVAENVFLFGI